MPAARAMIATGGRKSRMPTAIVSGVFKIKPTDVKRITARKPGAKRKGK
jgi:hypothetical protein